MFQPAPESLAEVPEMTGAAELPAVLRPPDVQIAALTEESVTLLAAAPTGAALAAAGTAWKSNPDASPAAAGTEPRPAGPAAAAWQGSALICTAAGGLEPAAVVRRMSLNHQGLLSQKEALYMYPAALQTSSIAHVLDLQQDGPATASSAEVMPTAVATGLSTAVAPPTVGAGAGAGARAAEGSNHSQKGQAGSGFALAAALAAAVSTAGEGVPRGGMKPHGSVFGNGTHYYEVPRRLTERLCQNLSLPLDYMSTYFPNVGHHAQLQLRLMVPEAAASAAAAAAPACYDLGVLTGAAGDGSRQSVVPGISSNTDRGSSGLVMVIVFEQDVVCTISKHKNSIRFSIQALNHCLDPFLNWRLFMLTKVRQLWYWWRGS